MEEIRGLSPEELADLEDSQPDHCQLTAELGLHEGVRE